MNLEEQLRELPALELAPPPDLAGLVLADLRRSRRRRRAGGLVVAVAAIVAGLAAVPQLTGGDARPVDPAAPDFADAYLEFPTPGGGPRAIHVYTTANPAPRSFLLDPETGRYHEFEYPELVLSPDLRTVALTTPDGRAGVADRRALLTGGEAAVDWFDAPAGTGLAWSPDGTAVLLTSPVRDEGTGTMGFSAHRYDLAEDAVTATPITVDILGSAVGWAADSRRYVALLPGQRSEETVEPGPLQFLEPDGSLGPRIEIAGGMVGGAGAYSASGELMFVDSSQIMSARPARSAVLASATGEMVAELPPGRPVGWYDEQTVALVGQSGQAPRLELVEFASGTRTATVDLSGLPVPAAVQLGSSAGLAGPAADLGF